MSSDPKRSALLANRQTFIGGSDARTIMGDDEVALVRLWREKRGEAEPEDLSGNLVVQLGPCDRRTEPALVSDQFGAGPHRYSAQDLAPCIAVDGGHPRWPGRSHRCGVRGQVHAAVVVFGRSRGREIYVAAAA